MSLEELRRAARGLENTVEAALVAYSNLASSTSAAAAVLSSSAEPAPADRLERELTSHLEQLAELNESMSRHASGPGGISLHTLQRHREILHDYSAEFQKTRASIKAARERASLLDTVRSEIRDYRDASEVLGARAGDASLLRERNALHHAIRLADDVIGRAQSTQGSLHEQRGMLGNIGRNVVGLGERMPLIGNLINAISARKRRDVMVLGGTAGVCFMLLFWVTLT